MTGDDEPVMFHGPPEPFEDENGTLAVLYPNEDDRHEISRTKLCTWECQDRTAP